MYFIKSNNYHTLNNFQYLLLFYFHTRIYLLLSIRAPAAAPRVAAARGCQPESGRR